MLPDGGPAYTDNQVLLMNIAYALQTVYFVFVPVCIIASIAIIALTKNHKLSYIYLAFTILLAIVVNILFALTI